MTYYIPDAAIDAASRTLAFLYGRADGSAVLAALQEAVPHLGEQTTEYGSRYVSDGIVRVTWLPFRENDEAPTDYRKNLMYRTVIRSEWKAVQS